MASAFSVHEVATNNFSGYKSSGDGYHSHSQILAHSVASNCASWLLRLQQTVNFSQRFAQTLLHAHKVNFFPSIFRGS
jgi:hypothetical protein